MEACLTEMEHAQEETPANKFTTNIGNSATKALRPTQSSNDSWKIALRQWVTTGKYTVGLPNPQVEVSRHFHTQQLSSFLLTQCPSLRMPAFERWWIDSKWEEYTYDGGHDPVIPCRPSLESESSKRLVEELIHACDNMHTEQAEDIVRELCLKTKHAAQEVSAMASRRLAPLSKGAHVALENGLSQHTLRYKRKSWKKPFCVQVNVTHYDKLWNAFCDAHPSLKREKRVLPAFHLLLFCLLLRYSSLSGGHLLNDLRGGGMQGSIMSDAFHVLQRFFPSQQIMECFASPWNSHLPLYASAFPDLDCHFGSVGDFREVSLGEGVCQANPPFSPGLMTHMAKRIEADLTVANDESIRLAYFVIVPTADAYDGSAPPAKQHAEKSFSAMITSPFCRLHMVLPSRQHGYVEGAQHLRPTRYKQSPYDTSLILLQSDAAAHEEALNHKSFEKELRKAFASRHEEELQQRQQKDSSS